MSPLLCLCAPPRAPASPCACAHAYCTCTPLRKSFLPLTITSTRITSPACAQGRTPHACVCSLSTCRNTLNSTSQRALLLARQLLSNSSHSSLHFSKHWPVCCLQLPAPQHQVVPVWAVIKTEYESSYQNRSYISVGHDSGRGIRYPLITAAIIACAFMSAYGLVPLLNTSQHSTPNDHTSLLDEYLRSWMHSGAIH